MAIDPADIDTVDAATADDGVFASADGGGDWYPLSDGPHVPTVYSLVIDPDGT